MHSLTHPICFLFTYLLWLAESRLAGYVFCFCFLFFNDICQTTQTHTHPFNGTLSGTTRVSRYQKGKTNLDFTEARDSEWQLGDVIPL